MLYCYTFITLHCCENSCYVDFVKMKNAFILIVNAINISVYNHKLVVCASQSPHLVFV